MAAFHCVDRGSIQGYSHVIVMDPVALTGSTLPDTPPQLRTGKHKGEDGLMKFYGGTWVRTL